MQKLYQNPSEFGMTCMKYV